jgi:uncharacterized protein YcfJ
MKRIHTTIALAVGLAFAGTSFAQGGYGGGRYDNVRYDYARVVRVDPIVERMRHPVATRDVCYDEPVEVYQPGYVTRRHDNTGATVLGALVGGALGNQVGKGDGRKAATIAGAVIGGSVGNNVARRNDRYDDRVYHSGGYATAYERRCETRTDYTRSNAVVGYDVTYRYRGDTFHTRLDHHPGNRLRVRIDGYRDVTPAE